MLNQRLNFGRTAFTALLSGALALGLAFSGVATPTFAADPTPTAPTQTEKNGRSLARAYERLNRLATTQAQNLTRADEFGDRVETRLNELRAQGVDVTVLETALAAYRTSLAQANTQHATAQSILTTHAGFDANGQVTDREAARTTVTTAGEALRETHRTLSDAVRTLRRAIRDFGKFWPQGTPKATEQPTIQPIQP